MTRGVPTIRPISWTATIPQLLAGATAILAMWALTGCFQKVMLYVATIYLAYSFGSRLLLAGAHRRGIQLAHQHRFEDAIREYESSYDFFRRYRWLDDYRSTLMMTPSAMSYREMALVNIAFAYSQLGDSAQSIAYYRRALDEFPDSQIAVAALKMMESASRPTTS
ncbi:MAG: tetratricopeptide repeat protein [Pirellulaceae bacterium]